MEATKQLDGQLVMEYQWNNNEYINSNRNMIVGIILVNDWYDQYQKSIGMMIVIVSRLVNYYSNFI